jgi:thioredoxin-dependent peroxiredoxin
MAKLNAGDPAPDFSLPTTDGTVISLKSLRGKRVVLYFYPKDSTPGCTKEACDFRDNLARVKRTGALIFGVSADSVASHRKFTDRFDLNFPLISDESREMLKAYGVWKQKSFLGKKFMGIERTTIIIGADGVVEHIFPKVKVLGHAQAVLEALGSKSA